MDACQLRAEIARFDASLPLAEASTPPASWYVEPAFDRLERDAVFRRTWQPVARTAQVRQPGDYVAGVHAGEPFVVVRGADGVLRAFRNVCRHKATQVAVGDGCAEQFTCPYHGWVYDLDGSLKAAPEVGGIRGFDRAAMGLPPLRVETWGPYVFVNGDASAPSLHEQLPELDAALERSGWQDLTWFARRTYDVPCNWKVFCDNYLDGGYHISHMHPTLDAQLDMQSYRTELFGRFSVQTSGPASERDARIDYEASGRIGAGTIYAFLFPNLMLNRYGPVLDTNIVLPVSADRCHVIFDFFFEQTEGADAAAFIERSLDQSETTQQEDMAVSASVQVGMASGAFQCGRYAPRVEKAVLHFHRLLAEHLVQATDATDGAGVNGG